MHIMFTDELKKKTLSLNKFKIKAQTICLRKDGHNKSTMTWAFKYFEV